MLNGGTQCRLSFLPEQENKNNPFLRDRTHNCRIYNKPSAMRYIHKTEQLTSDKSYFNLLIKSLLNIDLDYI